MATAKKKKPARRVLTPQERLAASNLKSRQLGILARALDAHQGAPRTGRPWNLEAEDLYDITHAAVFAGMPGQQNDRNTADDFHRAIIRVAATVRRK